MVVILNSIGILMNIAGLILIFNFEISPMTPKSGKPYIYTREEIEKKSSGMHQKEKSYSKLAAFGLYISIVGMVLQLASMYY